MNSINRKEIVREVVRVYLGETDPGQVPAFEMAYDAMFAAAAVSPSAKDGDGREGAPLTGEQFVDASIVAMTLWTAKSLLWFVVDPVLEDKVLPRMDEAEKKLAAGAARPEAVHRIRVLLEKALRKHLGQPPLAKT